MPQHKKRTALTAFGCSARKRMPVGGDTIPVRVKKIAFLAMVAVVAIVLCLFFGGTVVSPLYNRTVYDQLAAGYQRDNANTVPATEEYPAGMLDTFTYLYDQNPQVRGWLRFHTQEKSDFLGIDYPVMYAGNNDTYTAKNFHGVPGAYGTPFFDTNNTVEATNYRNKVLVVHGNSPSTGQMFAGLNKLVGGVGYAREATTVYLDTLFEQGTYAVIAVILTDEDATGDRYFNPCRTAFSTNGEFSDHLEQLRARSLFNYPVEAHGGDRLVALTVEVPRSTSKMENGRLTVIARQLRTGEDFMLDTNEILRNDDVLMPYAWYENQGLAPHSYYETGELPNDNMN